LPQRFLYGPGDGLISIGATSNVYLLLSRTADELPRNLISSWVDDRDAQG